MKRLIFIVAATLMAATSAQAQVVFKDASGASIVWDQHAGSLRTPDARVIELVDCSDAFQICFTDRRGFAFAYFRHCGDVDTRRLRFHPKFVGALHNDVWLVFDAAPNYMFRYRSPEGIIGMYGGRTPPSDFRRLLRSRDPRQGQLDAAEYRRTGAGTLAACRPGAD
ncbi:hypothetical protein [uncultured Massilia sp.]|uniref:hypothetical protein n=1 Tax=uncultured Massilia sp. TaxID=169973 RepID=UPI00258B3F09|nr:hypothetical protein [uncultured Massilia sp.]